MASASDDTPSSAIKIEITSAGDNTHSAPRVKPPQKKDSIGGRSLAATAGNVVVGAMDLDDVLQHQKNLVGLLSEMKAEMAELDQKIAELKERMEVGKEQVKGFQQSWITRHEAAVEAEKSHQAKAKKQEKLKLGREKLEKGWAEVKDVDPISGPIPIPWFAKKMGAIAAEKDPDVQDAELWKLCSAMNDTPIADPLDMEESMKAFIARLR